MSLRLPILVATAVALASCSSCASLPEGTPGPAADELARAVERHVDKAAWDALPQVAFTFRGKRSFLWDKARQLLHAKSGDVEVWLDLRDRGGFASRAGAEVPEAERQKVLDDAWAWFCNDSFWLNPLVKLFDDGAQRSSVTLEDGRRALLVRYTSGGVTPGDSYLWIVDAQGAPTHVRMWVTNLPKGFEFTWEGWQTLPGGAKVANLHKAMGFDVTTEGVTAPPPSSPDVFARLLARRAPCSAAAKPVERRRGNRQESLAFPRGPHASPCRCLPRLRRDHRLQPRRLPGGRLHHPPAGRRRHR